MRVATTFITVLFSKALAVEVGQNIIYCGGRLHFSYPAQIDCLIETVESLENQLNDEKAKTSSLTEQLASKQDELNREEEYRDLNKEFVEQEQE